MQAINCCLRFVNKRVVSFARSHWVNRVSAVGKSTQSTPCPSFIYLRSQNRVLWSLVSSSSSCFVPKPPSRSRASISDFRAIATCIRPSGPRTTASLAQRDAYRQHRGSTSPPCAPFSPVCAAHPACALTARCFLTPALPHYPVCASQIPRIACISRSQRRSSGAKQAGEPWYLWALWAFLAMGEQDAQGPLD